MRGHLDMLGALIDEYDLLPNIRIVNMAAGRGRLDVLDLLSDYDIYPDETGSTNALVKSSPAVKWLCDRGIFQLAEDAGVLAAKKKGNLDALSFLLVYQPELLNQKVADTAAKSGDVKILDWMKQKGLPQPSRETLNLILNKPGRVANRITKWLNRN